MATQLNPVAVVVVAPNYRTNIFGFSGAPGVTPNVGLLDQRLAMEWARDNVEAFGGDPNRITLFGQSAGGASVDFVPYAYENDPIAHAIIPQSGTANALFASSSSSLSVTNNWYKVSTTLGCGGALAGESTVACMRTKSTSDILSAMTSISNVAIASGFQPIVDNKTIPFNISDRLATGNFAQLPTLAGNTDNESGFFLALWFSYSGVTAQQLQSLPQWAFDFMQAIMNVVTPIGFTCAVMQAAAGRAAHNVPVWKYTYYGGNYTNTNLPYVGSDYHTSELPILFGTAAPVSGEPDSLPELSQERYMRQAWAAFARDPQNGLTNEMGWSQYSASGELRYASAFKPSRYVQFTTTALLTGIDLAAPNVVRIAYYNDTKPSLFEDFASQSFCASVNSSQGEAMTFLSAISPYQTLLGPIWNTTISLFLGQTIPPVDISNGGTYNLLLSQLRFFTSVLPK
jgi:carboxylesterase type B